MSSNKVKHSIQRVRQSKLLQSSFWGIAANAVQSILLSLFFVIIAREYSEADFANFLIANTVYQFLAAFSTLGLGQWFTRELVNNSVKEELINKFMKMQLYSGFFFYAVNIGMAYVLYQDETIRYLAIILGFNIIFDNIIYAIRALNVAEFKQQKTFIILLIDSLFKFLAAALLLITPINIVTLAIALIALRFVTLNIFLLVGSGKQVSFKGLIKYPISWKELKAIVLPNWTFIIIGSVSMIYWRIGNIIISKTLTLSDVANYEVSYRIFSLALILPLIFSNTVFPSLVTLHKAEDKKQFNTYYERMLILYLIYSLGAYTFFYSFSDQLIPWAFGDKYAGNSYYTKQMFLSILIFPAILLQANVLVAMHKEKADMWLNIISLVVNIVICAVGLWFVKSLSVINFAILGSFAVFQICQDALLIKHGVTTIAKSIQKYAVLLLLVLLYIVLSEYVNPYLLFIIFWAIIGVAIIKFITKNAGLMQSLKSPVTAT